MGLTSDIDANTSAHELDLFLAVNISKLKAILLRKIWNTLLNTLISFAPPQSGLPYEDLRVCDRMVIRIIQKQLHFVHNDAPHAIFLSEKNFEYGINHS